MRHVLLTGLVGLCFVSSAEAVLIIDAGPSSTSSYFVTGATDSFTIGSEFETTSSVTLNALGFLDMEGDGLAGNHQVGLWNVSDESLIASVTVTPTSSTVLSSQGTALWFMESISAVNIGPGTYRIGGEITGNIDKGYLGNDNIENGVTINGGFVQNTYRSGGFGYPHLQYFPRLVYATANAAVPEPSTLAIWGILGGLGMIAARRRRKRLA